MLLITWEIAVGAEFGVLGAVEAWADGVPVELGHARQRSVLAALLVEPGRPVPIDRLIQRVWGDCRPRQVRGTLYGYVCRLRQALAPAGVTIARPPGGYLLPVRPEAVDLHRFRRLFATHSADDRDRLALLEEALALWRGEAFAGLDSPWLNALRLTLGRERLAAELDRNEFALRLGRHGELLAAISVLADAHPLDERLAGQLMLALHRAGRQAEALEHYRLVRQRLVTGLGTEPAPALRQLHQRILAMDQRLPHPTGHRAETPLPRQLPAPPWLFSGRAAALADLDKSLGEPGGIAHAVEVVVLGGTGGIGKTWLALHWAHTHLDRFPDGQLHIDLRGFDPTTEPLPPEVAIRGFLDGLGVEPDAVPADPQAQIGLYRSLVANKRLLIVLDNAGNTTQVLPLLPGSPTCLVLITSRHRLRGLTATHGARLLDLDVLDDTEARELLAGHLGHDRTAAEPEAVSELVELCAGLPLALSIVAARAAYPPSPLADLADELHEVASRLDALSTGDLITNLRAVFSSSLRALSLEAAALFGLLGLTSGQDIDSFAVASLAGMPVACARTALRELVTAHVAQEHPAGRYRMHDLLRLYAMEHAPQTNGEPQRRLVDFYLHTAHAAERILHPHRLPIDIGDPLPGCQPRTFTDEAGALAWLVTEHANVLAAQDLAAALEWDTRVWQLAWALDTFHRRRGHLHHQLETWRAGLAASQRLAEPTPLVLAHRTLGIACVRAASHEEALNHLRRALTLAEEAGDVTNQAHTLLVLAYAWEHHGDDQRALEHAESALPLFTTLTTPVWLAQAHNQVGRYAARLGHHNQADTHCGIALALFREHHDRDGEAETLDTLGHLAHRTGQHTKALNHYQQALHIRRELAHTYGEADTLDQLGEVHMALSQHAEARHAWTAAASLYHTQHRLADAQRVTNRLALSTPPRKPCGN